MHSAEEMETESVAQGWQVCYACLLLLEKIVSVSPAQVFFATSFSKQAPAVAALQSAPPKDARCATIPSTPAVPLLCSAFLCAHGCPELWLPGMQVRWGGQRAEVRAVWLEVPRLLSHRHLWVRKAASRLLGLAFADPAIGEAHWCTSAAASSS